jgi:ribosome assembly protein YihI (activator of Der GTPase)
LQKKWGYNKNNNIFLVYYEVNSRRNKIGCKRQERETGGNIIAGLSTSNRMNSKTQPRIGSNEKGPVVAVLVFRHQTASGAIVLCLTLRNLPPEFS